MHRPRRWLAALLHLLLLHVAVLGAPGPCMERARASDTRAASAGVHAAHAGSSATPAASGDAIDHASHHAAHHETQDESGRSSHAPPRHCLTATSCASVAIAVASLPLTMPTDAPVMISVPPTACPASISRSPEPPPPRA